jgi:hypothetical protein
MEAFSRCVKEKAPQVLRRRIVSILGTSTACRTAEVPGCAGTLISKSVASRLAGERTNLALCQPH